MPSCVRDLFWAHTIFTGSRTTLDPARPCLTRAAVASSAEDHVIVGVDGKAVAGKPAVAALRAAKARVGSAAAVQVYLAPATLVVGARTMVRARLCLRACTRVCVCVCVRPCVAAVCRWRREGCHPRIRCPRLH